MTAPILPFPIFRAFDSAGNPLAGGKLYAYAAGTTTPQDTYSDTAGTTPNANPVILDSSGTATVRLSNLAYKFVLQDSGGATQWTVDQVKSSYLSTADIAVLLYPRTTDETAAGVTPSNYAYPAGDVRRYGADPTGVSDSTTAIQNAHNALPSTGGTIWFGGPGAIYLLQTTGVYVTITKPNVTLAGDAGAWVVSPNSSNIEDRSGNSILNGFQYSGTDCVHSINLRGPLTQWLPSSAGTDRFTIQNCVFLNMYNAGCQIVKAGGGASYGWDTLTVNNVVFQYSRDLSSDAGNYECLSRNAASSDASGGIVRVNSCTFRGVAGGVDVHNCKQLTISGGTRFEGVDVNPVKSATSDVTQVATQNVTIDETVSFDGAAINTGSANRHLNCTGLGRATANYSMYACFMANYTNAHIMAKFSNYLNECVQPNGGGSSFNSTVLDLSGARFDNCIHALSNMQGTVNIRAAEFINTSNIIAANGYVTRSLDISRCRFRDSYVQINKQCVLQQDFYSIQFNDFDYSIDNNGVIRYVDQGVDTGPTVIIDNNIISLTGGGNTVVANLASSGSRAMWFPNNQIYAVAGTPTITGGFYPGAWEWATSGTTGLYLYGIHDGRITVVNPNASGTVTYTISDAGLAAPIGTKFYAVRTHASNSLAFSTTAGNMNSNATVTCTTQWGAAMFTKLAANKWSCAPMFGTWSFT